MKLTLVISYYEAPLMLKRQIEYWREYSKDVTIIIIDDYSVHFPAKLILDKVKDSLQVSIELYQIQDDIYQNTFGARNLGFHVAKNNEWIWNLDIDHVVPWKSIISFFDMDLNAKGCYYLPAREIFVARRTSKVIQRHSDTYILTKETYWKTGGYDEDLIGFYFNGPATRFRKVLKDVAKGFTVNHGVKTIFFNTDLIEDASPIRLMEKRRYDGLLPVNKPPSILKFNWERIL